MDLAVDAAPPVGVEGMAQAGPGFVHQVAGSGLAVDADAAGADAQHLAAAVAQIDAADVEVGAPQLRIDGFAELVAHLVPAIGAEDRHLALATLVGVALEAAAGDRAGTVFRIHGAALEALDPDRIEAALLGGVRHGA